MIHLRSSCGLLKFHSFWKRQNGGITIFFFQKMWVTRGYIKSSLVTIFSFFNQQYKSLVILIHSCGSTARLSDEFG